MKTRTPLFQIILTLSLLTALILGGLPTPSYAEEGGNTIYLPQVVGGQGAGFDLLQDPVTIENMRMAEAELALPVPTLAALDGEGKVAPNFVDPALRDPDGDGVPSARDTCPTIPNRPRNGSQPAVCGSALNGVIDGLVFLKSRTFRPTQGLDTLLKQSQALPRIHVLLHVSGNDNGVVLNQAQRVQLEQAGVSLLSYLPHYTYYASVPRDGALLRQLVELESVYGISSLRPIDRIAPQVRLRGPLNGRNEDGTLSLEVDFFEDLGTESIEQLLNQAKIPFVHRYDQTYWITLEDWKQVRRLVIQDGVKWIDDLPDPAVNDTTNGMAVTGTDIVSFTLGYEGSGITLSMTESGLAYPLDHPDMDGRLIEGNSPIFWPFVDSDHAQKVAAIMIGDETSFAANRGVLPQADLVTFSTVGHTIKKQHYGIPKDARNDFGALLNNNSWSSYNCAKVGEYTKRAKFYDRAVYDEEISILKSSGNGRGPDGSFVTDTLFTDCTPDLFSLPHASATKNAIVVGNMVVSQAAPYFLAGISASSSAGPTDDGRLKPDVVAPGNGLFTVDYVEASYIVTPTTFSGTSASTPFTSGVVGMLAESFENQGISSNGVRPARYKAILVHTAEDQDPPGPDFLHGYGLIRTDAAVRIAEEWSDWGREGTVDDNAPSWSTTFDVDSPMSFYKATLVWDDEEGEYTSSMALNNDLDLTLTSPSGVVHRPFDVVLPFGATVDNGSIPCSIAACQDRLNNVEQVLVEPGSGSFVEQGTWTVNVDIHRLESSEQDFSLVLTPPCPLILTADGTLTGDLSCDYNPLAPQAVVIAEDDVELDCDGFKILGSAATAGEFPGEYKGIHILADDVTVRNCIIRRFDVGIDIGDSSNKPDGASLLNNELSRTGSRAINLTGDDHRVEGNSISEMVDLNGVGIRVRGDNIDLIDNNFFSAYSGAGDGLNAAVSVVRGSSGGQVNENGFSGSWLQGVRLVSLDSLEPVTNYTVDGNEFEGIQKVAVRLAGDVRDSSVSNNIFRAWGDDSPAILFTEEEGLRPQGNSATGNIIDGFDYLSQTGIELFNADDSSISGANFIAGVGVGIREEGSKGSLISGNTITNDPLGSFNTAIAIQSVESDSAATSLINGNTIDESAIGIEAHGGGPRSISNNSVDVGGIAISLANAEPSNITSNGLTTNFTGILVTNSPDTTVVGNGMSPNTPGAGGGIAILNSDRASVTSNTLTDLYTGITVRLSVSPTVSFNTIDTPAWAGITLWNDEGAFVSQNEIVDSANLGIHYGSGTNATIDANEITSIAAGIGIRAGDGGSAPCPVDVDELTISNNVLSGGALDIEILCDAGTVHRINN